MNRSVRGVQNDRPPLLRRAAQSACPGGFIIFFLFKCHFVACSAVYKTECVLRGSRVSYHLSSFVAYKHNSTRSLALDSYCLRIRLAHGRAAGARLKIASNPLRVRRRARIAVRGVPSRRRDYGYRDGTHLGLRGRAKMSSSYADGLSPYENKGVLGLEERYDSVETLRLKCGLLADWIQGARHVVVHTGAGISTAAGIPDFRGTNGVWTLEQKGLKPSMNISFDEAIPTKTHMALKKLIETKKIKFIISQNIDGLHLRSGIQRQHLAELHGNMFTEQCDKCGRQFIRNFATKSVGKKSLDTVCRSEQIGGRPCRGRMHDTILDWEHNLPDSDLTLSDLHSSVADLSICLGTTLQIIPSGNLPLYTKKYGGRLVICNLQPTKHDKKADLIINGNVDEVMIAVMNKLGFEIPEYESGMDPTRNSDTTAKEMDWTIPTSRIKEMNVLYKKVCKPMRRKRKTFMYERERTDTKRETKARKQAFTVKQEIKTEANITTSGEMCKTENDHVADNSVKTEENAKDVEKCRYSMEDATEHNTDLKMNQTV